MVTLKVWLTSAFSALPGMVQVPPALLPSPLAPKQGAPSSLLQAQEKLRGSVPSLSVGRVR